MTTRPDSLPTKLWAKLDDKQKAHAAKVWPGMPATSATEVSKDDIIKATTIGDAVEAIMSVDAAPGKDTDKGTESPAKVSDMPTDVVSWIKAEQAKVTPELSAYIHETVDKVIELDERKIVLFEKIDAAGLDVPAQDSTPNPEANSVAARLGDIYYVPGKTLDSDPVKRHRLHDLADQLFGNGYVVEVNKLEGMGDDTKKDYGENKYQEDLALAKKKLSTLRRKFSEAADAVVAYRAVNALSGIDVVVSNAKSPKPFMLRERMLNADGTAKKDKDGMPIFGRTASIPLNELEAYRADVAKMLLDGGTLKRAGSESEPGTMYDAVRASRPPKKKRTAGAATGKAGDKPAATGNDVNINNINRWESASADEAALTETPGFMGEWLKRANDPDKAAADAFILSEGTKMKFYDRVFGMNNGQLLKRFGELLDAQATKPAEQEKAA